MGLLLVPLFYWLVMSALANEVNYLILLFVLGLLVLPGPKYKYGMNEVQIGMTVPILGVELARHRMPKSQISKAVTQVMLVKVFQSQAYYISHDPL